MATLRGNGDGTFGPPIQIGPIYGASPVGIADLDGDGSLDLVATNTYLSTATVLLGNGDETFGRRLDYSTGIGPSSVAIGDLDHDGAFDVVVANRDAQSVSVLRNIGAPTVVGVGPGRAPVSLVAHVHPTPARDDVTLDFELPRAARTVVSVFDLTGRSVTTLASGSFAAGPHTIRWDRRRANGSTVRPGIYFVDVRTGDLRVTRRAVLVP